MVNSKAPLAEMVVLTGNRKQETGNRKQETGNRKPETRN
jgi:hypothetical protein